MRYKTCVTLAEKTPSKLKLKLKIALRKSDYAELRLDYLKPGSIPDAIELVKANLKRCVCTLRPKVEGGKFSSDEKNRKSILKLIAEYDPFLLDVEYNTLKNDKSLRNYLRKRNTNILVSWHDFKKTPDSSSLIKMFHVMEKFSEYIKIVTTAKSVNDSSRILSLYNTVGKKKLIAFSMGDYGRISRILCLFLGSPYTYVSLVKPIAPGQMSLDQIKLILKTRRK